MTQHPAWVLVVAGVILTATGLAWLLAPHSSWLGRLPGDIRIEGGSVRFYFPLVSCLVVSLVLSVILWLVRSLWR